MGKCPVCGDESVKEYTADRKDGLGCESCKSYGPAWDPENKSKSWKTPHNSYKESK